MVFISVVPLFQEYRRWLWRWPRQCTWQTEGWSISFPKGNDKGLPLLRAAPLRAYTSWELGGLSINGRFGVRSEKSSSPISVSKSETLSAGRSLPVPPYMHKDTCCLTLIQKLNQSRCLQPDGHKCIFVPSLLKIIFCSFVLGQLCWLDINAKALITHIFNIRSQSSQYSEAGWTRYFRSTLSLQHD